MSKTEKLDRILLLMREEGRSTDTEAAHIYADELLLELCKVLTDPPHKKKVEEILTAWQQVDKWYA